MDDSKILRPRRLCEGDTVAVLSPSWGGPATFPHVFDLGLRNLREYLGVKVNEYATTRMTQEDLDREPSLRARDLNRAFADPDVKGIIASIGGDDSVRILPHLDLPLIRRNPKILMGYSDTTILTTVLNQQGLVTFNGPSIMAGFAQMRRLPEAYRRHVQDVLMNPLPELRYQPYATWVDHYADWNSTGYDGETSEPVVNEGWRWIQGAGVGRGRLFGGCIEVLEFLKGTPYWPSVDFWEGRILFFETSEDKPTVNQVKWMLRNYGTMGALARVAGIVFGRARGYGEEEKEALYRMVQRVVGFEFGRKDLPILANADFGHTEPQWVLPLGVLAEIDGDAREFRLIEAAVT